MYLDVIKNYPNTLSAEASECYVIKILTLFSNPAFVKEAAKRYEIVLDELEDAKAHLRQAKRTAMAQPFMVGLEAYVERLKFVVKMWESTPFGRKALQQAEERAEKFLEKNKYGLYRGEVLLDIGTAYLVSFFDVDNGEKWLTRAAEWFDNVQQFDKDLKDFELPESVRKVSQPPKEERYKDRWTNIKLSQPKAGQFFNHRSCSWYWNSKRKDATLLQGLIAFAKEDYETAEKRWNLLAELDKEFYAQQKASGWENATTLARLTWNLRNQKGSLYATPEEMASFKDTKRRMAILIADLYYESEQHQKALSIYQRLEENREFGTLSKNELAYVMLGIFSCLCWEKKFDETAYLFHKAKLFEGTPSEARAYFYYGNRISRIGGLDGYKFSIRAYETCIQKHPNSKEANNARLFLAEKYKDLGDLLMLSKNLDEAKKCYSFASKYYRDYRKRNNETTIAAQIDSILKDLERKNLLNK
jgi:tetratricopeptide (TPR) repeat protein